MTGTAIVSGGLDSVTMLHLLVSQGERPHVLAFDYGQKHVKELQFSQMAAERLGLHWSRVDLTSITELLSRSALTSDISVPEGHYAEDNMAITVVPNRNMMMLSIATAVTVNNGGYFVAAGMHAGDHFQYPDCRPQFIATMWRAAMTANEGFISEVFRFVTPFLEKSKTHIARVARELNVPVELTWSCYKGSGIHCGRCGTCVERLEALHEAEVDDPTQYEDPDYWRKAIEDYKTQAKETKPAPGSIAWGVEYITRKYNKDR